MHDYLSGREHRVRVGSLVSNFLDIEIGVTQGSVLGQKFFIVFINDLLFLVQKDICNIADDTLYTFVEKNIFCSLSFV